MCDANKDYIIHEIQQLSLRDAIISNTINMYKQIYDKERGNILKDHLDEIMLDTIKSQIKVIENMEEKYREVLVTQVPKYTI